MKAIRIAAWAVALAMPWPATAMAAGTASVDRGAHVAIIGGCHDCHTDGYAQTNGRVDPAKALKGNPVGFQGPWGTTYATNLRISIGGMSEDAFVQYARTFQTRPPMPWFNVHALDEDDSRSLYRYIKSLGEPGAPAPDYVPPGGRLTMPFIVFAPPTMPAR